MKNLIFILLICASCTTARQLAAISPGMTRQEVVNALGRPKGVGMNDIGEYLVYNYANHGGAPVSGGRTNYFVQFKDGKVVSYGPLSTMAGKR